MAAANPLATEAGYQMLKAGGTAVDAAVAVQMVLALVGPQSSGLGGGAFLLHGDGWQVQAFDGRKTAPAAADENLFLKPDGKPMAFPDVVVGGRSVDVPDAVRKLEPVHRRHGKRPWAELTQPAIELAEQGFAVSPRLHGLLANDKFLCNNPVARAHFYAADGQPWPAGHLLKNPAMAAVLRAVAAQGSRALHEGLIAAAIAAKVRGHAGNPGAMMLADLTSYQAKERVPLCHDWVDRGNAYRLCGMPPQNSGAIAMGQNLSLLAHTGAAALPLSQGQPDADWLQLYTEAARLAFAAGGQLDEPARAGLPRAARGADRPGPRRPLMRTAQPATAGPQRTSFAPCPNRWSTAPATSASSKPTAMRWP